MPNISMNKDAHKFAPVMLCVSPLLKTKSIDILIPH